MLNLLHAKTLLAVIDAGGFRAAARDLDIAPSTIVQHIRQLESTLGAPLLERRRGAISLTAQGAEFLPLARSLIATAERARAAISGTSVRIAAASNAGIYLLQDPLASFRASTGIELHLWIGANPVVRERLKSAQADLAVLEHWPEMSGFETHVWRHEPLVVIVSPKHAWARRHSVKAEELACERLLGGEPGTGTGSLLRRALGPLAERLTTIDGYGSTEGVKRAVRAGHGISLVMASAVADEVEAGTLVTLPLEDVDLIKPISLALPASAPSTSLARRFIDHALALRTPVASQIHPSRDVPSGQEPARIA